MYVVQQEALLKACLIVGSQAELARMIGVSRARVNNWLNREDRVPLQYILAIETATGGKVTRCELVPAFKEYVDENSIEVMTKLNIKNLYERLSILESTLQKLNEQSVLFEYSILNMQKILNNFLKASKIISLDKYKNL